MSKARGWHGTLLAGKRDEAGTMYRRARYYDSETGQFTQEDPVGLAGGLNLYAFGAGDAVNHEDPYGTVSVLNALGPIVAFTAIVVLARPAMGTGGALLGAGAAVIGAGLGAGAAAGVESLVSSKTFMNLFWRNFGRAGWILAGMSVVAATEGGGLVDAGANHLLQGYVQSKEATGGHTGGLTLGSVSYFSGAGPHERSSNEKYSLGEHEFGHTLQFIGLSALGDYGAGVYIGLGILGARWPDSAGKWWEDMASALGGFF